MHRKGAAKAAQNQRTIALRNNTAPLFHRKSTVLSTDGMIHATRARDISALMHSCADRCYDSGVQGRLTAKERARRVCTGEEAMRPLLLAVLTAAFALGSAELRADDKMSPMTSQEQQAETKAKQEQLTTKSAKRSRKDAQSAREARLWNTGDFGRPGGPPDAAPKADPKGGR